MKPSSSISEPAGRADTADGGLFDGVLARGPVREAVGDRAWLQAMLDFEAALAVAQARAGLFGTGVAEAIRAACRAEAFDLGEIGREAANTGNPVVPMIERMRDVVGQAAAAAVHRGATSQDVIDTAAMLVSKRALGPLLQDVCGAADAAAELARAHRATPMLGRTLLQQAVPTTFGLKAAGWMAGLDAAAARLTEVRDSRLAVQFGGAAGTMAGLDDKGPEIVRALAEELELAEPVLAWHTERTRIAELGSGLGEAAGVIAKPALDVILMAQTEVGEVREGSPGRGGSSAMEHKRNPIAAVSARACAMRAPGLVAELLAAMEQEHERAAGPWHAEWRPLSDLLTSVGSAAAWLRDCLEHLEVDEKRLRENLARHGSGDDVGSAADLVGKALDAHASARASRPATRPT
jgi:3-carboxy-cis,cis-muconate cycloisomerase